MRYRGLALTLGGKVAAFETTGDARAGPAVGLYTVQCHFSPYTLKERGSWETSWMGKGLVLYQRDVV